MTSSDEPISLKDYVDMRFSLLENTTEATRQALEKRFDAMNEFRQSLADNARLLMPRSEAEQRFAQIADQLGNLSMRVAAIDQKGEGKRDLWGYIVGVFGILSLIATMAENLFLRLK
jgi:hypothetical protein